MELHDAVVKGFLLGGGEVGAPSAASVVLSSIRGKGGFKLREEFLGFVVSVGGGLGELDEIPLDYIISLSVGGGQVVIVGIEVLG